MKNQAQKKIAAPDEAPLRPRLRVARGGRSTRPEAPEIAETVRRARVEERPGRVRTGARSNRRDPLAYRAAAPDAPNPRPVRPAPVGKARPGRRNRRRIPPVVLWNRRFRGLARLLTFALCVEVAWLCMASPLLRVKTVEVNGAQVRTPQQIARIAGLTKPSNIFRAPVGRAEKALAALPEVQSVEVERRLPRTLAVTLHERMPLAGVSINGQWWAIDASGLLYRKMDRPVAGRPALYATVSSPPVLGTKIKIPALDAALKCLTRIPSLPLAGPVAFHVDGRNEAWLNNTSGFKVRLGPLDDAPERLAVTERLLKGPDGREILRKAAVLDMATPDNEVYKQRAPGAAYRLTSDNS